MDTSFEKHKQHTFDCFCKKLLKNEMRDYYDEIQRRRKYEVSFEELTAKELGQLVACDTYFADSQHTFNVLGNDILVNDETIAEALISLPENKRDIILLSYLVKLYHSQGMSSLMIAFVLDRSVTAIEKILEN